MLSLQKNVIYVYNYLVVASFHSKKPLKIGYTTIYARLSRIEQSGGIKSHNMQQCIAKMESLVANTTT